MDVINIRDRKNQVEDIIKRACKAYVLRNDPTLKNNADAWATATLAQFNALKISESYLRLPQTMSKTEGLVKSQFTFNPKITTNAQNRKDFVGLKQEDMMIIVSEDITIDGRLVGADATADLQTFPNPEHFLSAGSCYTTATNVPLLRGIYSGYESLKVNDNTYIPARRARQYLRYPRVNQTLTYAAGAVTGSNQYVETDTKPLDLAAYNILSGNKTTEYVLNCLPTPGIAVPEVNNSELVITKWCVGYLVGQGAVLYDDLMGQIV